MLRYGASKIAKMMRKTKTDTKCIINVRFLIFALYWCVRVIFPIKARVFYSCSIDKKRFP